MDLTNILLGIGINEKFVKIFLNILVSVQLVILEFIHR